MSDSPEGIFSDIYISDIRIRGTRIPHGWYQLYFYIPHSSGLISVMLLQVYISEDFNPVQPSSRAPISHYRTALVTSVIIDLGNVSLHIALYSLLHSTTWAHFAQVYWKACTIPFLYSKPAVTYEIWLLQLRKYNILGTVSLGKHARKLNLQTTNSKRILFGIPFAVRFIHFLVHIRNYFTPVESSSRAPISHYRKAPVTSVIIDLSNGFPTHRAVFPIT